MNLDCGDSGLTDEMNVSVDRLARDLVQIERKSFYGSEPERDRLRKMRELIDEAVKEIASDS